jgi:hypothetical protein
MTRVGTLVVAMWLGLCAATDTAAAPQTRDAAASMPAPAQAGTARIAGRVTTAGTSPQPVRRAIITLTGAELPGGRTAISDADGRFLFERLPAGRFMLTGTKRAYLPGAYGATRPGRAGVPLQVSAGDQRVDADFTLAPGAAITGALRDPSGEPVAGIEVAAFRFPAPGAGNMLVAARSATTDDRGVYRLFGLMPGEYVVSSVVRIFTPASDLSAFSSAQIDEMIADLERRAAPGAPGTTGRTGFATKPAGTYAYAPVFYPGVPSPDGAAKVVVAIGEERTSVDFTIQLTRMATIEGELIDRGTPSTPLIINPIGVQLPPFTGSAPVFWSETTPTGRSFKYTNVLPGRYRITAQSQATGVAWARAEVEVAAADLTGLTLTMRPTLQMSGRMVFDGATVARPADLGTIGLRLASVHGSGTSTHGGYTRMGNAVIPPARVEPDGQFQIGGILPDSYRFLATVPGTTGWWLRSAIVNGVDVLDHPLDVSEASDLSNVVLTFSDRRTRLSGRITTTTGQPAPAYFIAVFPVDRALWRPQARRIQFARTATDGTWIIDGLPAGDYLLAALSDLTAEDLLDPAFLADLLPGAAKLAIAEGEKKTQDLQINPGLRARFDPGGR